MKTSLKLTLIIGSQLLMISNLMANECDQYVKQLNILDQKIMQLRQQEVMVRNARSSNNAQVEARNDMMQIQELEREIAQLTQTKKNVKVQLAACGQASIAREKTAAMKNAKNDLAAKRREDQSQDLSMRPKTTYGDGANKSSVTKGQAQVPSPTSSAKTPPPFTEEQKAKMAAKATDGYSELGRLKTPNAALGTPTPNAEPSKPLDKFGFYPEGTMIFLSHPKYPKQNTSYDIGGFTEVQKNMLVNTAQRFGEPTRTMTDYQMFKAKAVVALKNSSFRENAEKKRLIKLEQEKQMKLSKINEKEAEKRKPQDNMTYAAAAKIWGPNGQSYEFTLANQTLKGAFKAFLQSEFSAENLNFMDLIDNMSRKPIEERDNRLPYELFVKSNKINIESGTKNNLDQLAADGQYQRMNFSAAYNEVRSLMSKDSFSRFKIKMAAEYLKIAK